MAHIGSSGQSFGDIAADISKAVLDSDRLNSTSTALMEQNNATSTSLPTTVTPSISLKSENFNNLNDTDNEAEFDEFIQNSKSGSVDQFRMPPRHVTSTSGSYSSSHVIRRDNPSSIRLETCRKSTISFNFDFSSETDDILSSVLAVMDQLNNSKIEQTQETNQTVNVNITRGGCFASNKPKSKPPVNFEEPIYDEVPPLESEKKSVRINKSVEINKRPNRPPPQPKLSNTITCSSN